MTGQYTIRRANLSLGIELIVTGLLIFYIVVLPGGLLGVFVLAIALGLVLVQIRDPLAVAVYLIFFGTKTLGILTLGIGLPGIGGKVGILLCAIIFLLYTDLLKTFSRLAKPLFHLLWIMMVLFLWYLEGPQSSAATSKFINVFVTGVLSILCFWYLFNRKTIDWLRLGQLGVISAFLAFAVWAMMYPDIKPMHTFDMGSVRAATDTLRQSYDVEFGLRNVVTGMALIGFVLLYADPVDRKLSGTKLAIWVFYTIAAFVLMGWNASRLTLLSAVVVVFAVSVAKPKYAVRYSAVSIFIVAFGALFVATALNNELQFVTSVADSSSSIDERFNRAINWQAGVQRIEERPMFGHGLGGYYIDGYSAPGEGTYAHNLILELLSELGWLGTLLILGPLVFWFKALKGIRPKNRLRNGHVAIPLILIYFLQSMISFDLSKNIAFFALLWIVAMSVDVKKPHRFNPRSKKAGTFKNS